MMKAVFDARKIPGWQTDVDLMALYLVARYGPGKGKIVEIGTWQGKSTCVLAKGAKDGRREKVYTIDHHKGSPEHHEAGVMPIEGTTLLRFRNHMKAFNFEDYVIPIISTSEEAAKKWKEPIRFLFIDGDHSYPAVKQDFLMWSKFVVKNGIIALDDVSKEGPRRVLEEFVFPSDDYANPITIGKIIFFNKKIGIN